jgi:antirestriction protein
MLGGMTFNTPNKCYVCGNPATMQWNTSAVMAASVPSKMEWVCADHNPLQMYWNRQAQELEKLQALYHAFEDHGQAEKQHITVRNALAALRTFYKTG